MWRRVNSQIKTGDLELQYAVMDKSADSRRDVYFVSGISPLCGYQFSMLCHRRTAQQQEADHARKHSIHFEFHSYPPNNDRVKTGRNQRTKGQGLLRLGDLISVFISGGLHLGNDRVSKLGGSRLPAYVAG